MQNRLRQCVTERRRVLIGFDFPYAYPEGFAGVVAPDSRAPPWQRIWDRLAALVQDDLWNGNNRFAVASYLNSLCGEDRPGPFWNAPARAVTELLQAKRPGFPFPCADGTVLSARRLVERRLPGTQEVWKLYTSGSVGSQALLGIPWVRALRQDATLAPFSRVWPFETGFTPWVTREEGPAIVHAEIWPGTVRAWVDPTIAIRDEAQVLALVRWASWEDSKGTLGRWFAAPEGLSDAEIERCIKEEGWILGAG